MNWALLSVGMVVLGGLVVLLVWLSMRSIVRKPRRHAEHERSDECSVAIAEMEQSWRNQLNDRLADAEAAMKELRLGVLDIENAVEKMREDEEPEPDPLSEAKASVLRRINANTTGVVARNYADAYEALCRAENVSRGTVGAGKHGPQTPYPKRGREYVGLAS